MLWSINIVTIQYYIPVAVNRISVRRPLLALASADMKVLLAVTSTYRDTYNNITLHNFNILLYSACQFSVTNLVYGYIIAPPLGA